MEVDNFDRSLTAFKKRKPFRPFTVMMVDGDRFEVDHPDALVVRDGYQRRCSSSQLHSSWRALSYSRAWGRWS